MRCLVKSILIYKTLSMMSNIGLYLPQCTLKVIKLQIKVSRHFQRGQDFEDIEMEKIIWPLFLKVLVSTVGGGCCPRSTVIDWRMLTCSLEVNRRIIARGGFRFSTVIVTGDADDAGPGGVIVSSLGVLSSFNNDSMIQRPGFQHSSLRAST